jgi:PEP-CTERM motif
MKKLFPLLTASILIGSSVKASTQAAPIVYAYDVQSSSLTTSGGSANGRILADTVSIGTWSLTGFNYTYTNQAYTPSIAPFTSMVTSNYYSYGLPGVGIAMTGATTGQTAFQVKSFGYSISGSIDSAYANSYQISGVTIFGHDPSLAQNTGPNIFTSWVAGSLTFSDFSGTATLSDPSNNLDALDGLTFSSNTDIGGYNQGNGNGKDWKPDALSWKVTTDAGSTMTFAVNYNGGTSANENTAFGFNVNAVPEPSTYALFGIGALVMVIAYRVRIRKVA